MSIAVVCSCLPFPSISLWANILDADMVIFDLDENFRKMSCRNRYNISGANNPILLSIPLQNGRNQRVPMKEVKIYNIDNWQTKHWRTLVSVYKRTPFFEYYQPSLQKIFENTFTNLIDFNVGSMEWVKKQLKLKYDEKQTKDNTYIFTEPVNDLQYLTDMERKDKIINFPRYYQVFEDRIGFQPNLSILDMLFSLGPATTDWLKENRNELINR